MQKIIYKTGDFLKKNSATILTGVGMVGVVGTAILSSKAARKADHIINEKDEIAVEIHGRHLTKVERAIAATPVYLPTILMGAVTLTCIYGSNHINKKNQAIIMGAYAYLNNLHNEYKAKVISEHGIKAHRDITNSIARDKYEQQEIPSVFAENNKLYYDEYSGRYFNMTDSELQKHVYDINKMYNFRGELSLNDIYDYLGQDPTDYGATVGWASVKDWECTGFSWIEIEGVKMDMPDDLECYALTFNVEPSNDYTEWTYHYVERHL